MPRSLLAFINLFSFFLLTLLIPDFHPSLIFITCRLLSSSSFLSYSSNYSFLPAIFFFPCSSIFFFLLLLASSSFSSSPATHSLNRQTWFYRLVECFLEKKSKEPRQKPIKKREREWGNEGRGGRIQKRGQTRMGRDAYTEMLTG